MNLASLPSDIIRQIFWTGQLPIESSRLISSRWNTLALDPPSIALKQRFPSIDSFRWHINPDLSSTIAMDIPDHCVAYFGVARWWQYRFETSTYAGTVEVTSPTLPAMPVLFDGFSEISESEKAVWNRIMRLLRRSSRIKQLTFNPRNEKFCAFNILLNVLDEVVVEDLVIPAISNLSESIGSKMLDALRAYSIKTLFISTQNHDLDLVKFFTEASQFVPVIKMWQSNGNRKKYFRNLRRLLAKMTHLKTTIIVFPNCVSIEVVAV